MVRDGCAQMPESVVQAVLLLISEVVTNAVTHARTTIEVTVDWDVDGVTVTVADGHAGRPVLLPESQAEEGGRGVQLLEALASTWGVQDRLTGKAVWFRVDRNDADG